MPLSAAATEAGELEKVAKTLREAARTRVPCPPVRDRLPAGDIPAAYAVQRINTEHAQREGRRIVGRKIGLTSPAVQRQLGVDQPDFGVLFDDMTYHDNAEVALAGLLQPRAEAEVALVLGRDLDQARCTFVDVLRATDFALPAIEVCGSRIAGWDISITDTVADNASSGVFVLGTTPVSLSTVDLAATEMALTLGGEVRSTGRGDAVLGHPLHAAAWLAGTTAGMGDPLRAGDIVLTGALGPMVAVGAGDVVEATLSGLGRIRVRFTGGDTA